MKTYILDTNVIIALVRNNDFQTKFYQRFASPHNTHIISVVTEGELYSLAIQWNWGKRKQVLLQETIANYLIYPIKARSIIDAYAQIDAYSQGKLNDRPLPTGLTARNMGKKDLWIAATAHVTQATLLTMDKDFTHLKDVFFEVEIIDPSAF